MEFDRSALARLRASRALSLRDLAERIGIGQDVIWRLEQGRTKRPHGSTVRKLAAGLGVEPDALMREIPPSQETEKAAPA